MKCPHCQQEINIGALIGSVSTPAKARAARENAKLGGWPKGKKRKKSRKRRMPNMKTKQAQNIQAGDTYREHSRDRWRTVKRVLDPLTAGSWQECRGTGFPRLLDTGGEVRVLVYGAEYEVRP